eukprot:7969583-Pyramimonas_sp.AAC.1
MEPEPPAGSEARGAGDLPRHEGRGGGQCTRLAVAGGGGPAAHGGLDRSVDRRHQRRLLAGRV